MKIIKIVANRFIPILFFFLKVNVNYLNDNTGIMKFVFKTAVAKL